MYYILFTTTTCIKCPSFKNTVFENIKFSGNILNETSPDFMEFAGRFNVASAPTIIIFEDESLDKELFRTSEEYELADFIKTL